ncbi:MAG: alpha/beta hydrolase fold domain-containing protein [Verrucomicrobiota bacterium]
MSAPADASNPKISLLLNQDLGGLPPATVITAQIDPLCSEGEALANKLEADGVTVTYQNFEGVTHEFFGMNSILKEARDAQNLVAAQLQKAFGGAPSTATEDYSGIIPKSGAAPDFKSRE